jgi:hypothetical protein
LWTKKRIRLTINKILSFTLHHTSNVIDMYVFHNNKTSDLTPYGWCTGNSIVFTLIMIRMDIKIVIM